MLQSIIGAFAVVAVAVVVSSPSPSPSPVVVPDAVAVAAVGWNQLLGGRNFFGEDLNTILTKSSDDVVIMEELKELVAQDDVMKTAYLKYRTMFKKTNDASYDRINHLKRNMLKVARHNLGTAAGKHSWTMAVNHFADMTSLELEVMMGSFSDNSTARAAAAAGPYVRKSNKTRVASDKASLDYRKMDIVSKVKQQGSCGTCAMFASCAILESADSQENAREPLNLSPQELADCAVPGFTCPKGGSSAGDSLDYMIKNGISSWEDYPYTAWDAAVGQCKGGSTPRRAFALSQQLTSDNDEQSLKMNLLDNGPLVVYIYASDAFQSYGKGVYQGTECGDLPINHAVTLIGYGKEKGKKGKKFWLIKNSWDTTWGEDGYGKMQHSVCGILDRAYSVTAAPISASASGPE